jgi:hypothetical protein
VWSASSSSFFNAGETASDTECTGDYEKVSVDAVEEINNSSFCRESNPSSSIVEFRNHKV